VRIQLSSLAFTGLLVACETKSPSALAVAGQAAGAETPIGPGGCFVATYGRARRSSDAPDSIVALVADSAPLRRSPENTFRVAREPNPGQFPFSYRMTSIDTARIYLHGTWNGVSADSAELTFIHRPGTVAVRRENGKWAGQWRGIVHDPRDFMASREVRDVRLRPVSCEMPVRG